MIPKFVKTIICSNRALSTPYGWLRAEYLSCLLYWRRRRLRRYGLEIISKVHDRLKNTGAKYFGDYGTMLGVVRDKRFIKHDDDVDYSVIAGSLSPKSLLKVFDGQDGFSFSHAFEFRGKIAQITFSYKKIDVDFFYIYENADLGVAPGFLPTEKCPYATLGSNWRSVYLERPKAGEIIAMDFMGRKIMIPENYDALLTNCYGDWRTSVVRWSHTGNTGQKERVRCADMATIVGRGRILQIGRV